ncbi:MAG: transposase, partial [Candidatus Paceibacterota bacterium]
KRQQITEHMFGTLKRQRGFTFTLLRGKEKVLGEVGLMFIGYNLSRCISVIGAEKLIRALRECCLPCVLKVFGLVLSHYRQLSGKTKSSDGFSMLKFIALHGSLLNQYEVSLVGK